MSDTQARWELLDNTQTLIEQMRRELIQRAETLQRVAVKRLELALFTCTNFSVHRDHNSNPSYYFAITDVKDGRSPEEAFEAVQEALGYGVSWCKSTTVGVYEVRFAMP